MWVGDGDGEAHGRKKMPAKRPGVSRLKERLSEAKPSGSSAFKAARPGGTRGGRQGVITKARPRLSTGGGMSAFANGEDVEARCKGSKKHYAGKIFMDNGDGTYDVKFDDGDRDRAVKKADVIGESSGKSSTKRSDRQFRVGDKVEGNFRGRGTWQSGELRIKSRDGSFTIRYNGGTTESGVPTSRLRHLRSYDGKQDRNDEKLRQGNKVEARCKGSKKHYAGKIHLDNRDGTYDVKFDDGDRDK